MTPPKHRKKTRASAHSRRASAAPEPRAARLLLPLALALPAFGCGGGGHGGLKKAAGAAPVSQADGIAKPASTSAWPAPMRRLTNAEYNNTVRDLLGDTTAPAATFAGDERSSLFASNSSLAVGAGAVQQYQSAAEALAVAAVKNLPALLPCDPAAAGEAACGAQFVTAFGKRAFRRPLSPDEQARYADLLSRAAAAGGGFAAGVQAVVAALLQSPYFLYRVELGTGAAVRDGVLKLSPYEVATRLSYLYLGSTPDAELLAAADAGSLATPSQIEAQAQRLMRSPRAREAFAGFYQQWLGLDRLAGLTKDKASFPEFEALRPAMLTESRMFIDYVVWEGDGRLGTLLSAPFTFADESLARYYGVAGVSGAAFAKVDVGAAGRAGVISHASVLAIYAHDTDTSPTLRGKFVRNRLLCGVIGPPPPGVPTTPAGTAPGKSTREAFRQHAANPVCAGCHNAMDPIGFGFEGFDAAGRARTQDGAKIDVSGEIRAAGDASGAFDGPVELAGRLAKSAEVEGCAATQWFRYAMGRTETAADDAAVAQLKQIFSDAHGDFKALMTGVARTDAFLYLGTGTAPAPDQAKAALRSAAAEAP